MGSIASRDCRASLVAPACICFWIARNLGSSRFASIREMMKNERKKTSTSKTMPIAQPFHRSSAVQIPPAIAPINRETKAEYTAVHSHLSGREGDRGPHYTEADLGRALPGRGRTNTASESTTPQSVAYRSRASRTP